MTIKAYKFNSYLDSKGSPQKNLTEIPLHKCNQNDFKPFKIDEEGSEFLKFAEQMWSKYYCFDDINDYKF